MFQVEYDSRKKRYYYGGRAMPDLTPENDIIYDVVKSGNKKWSEWSGNPTYPSRS
jgi:hypothetical protein